MPKIRWDPINSSSCMALIIQEKRLALAAEKRAVCAPSVPQGIHGLAAFNGVADGVGTTEDVKGKLLGFILVRRLAPGKLGMIKIVRSLNEGERREERLKGFSVLDMDLHPAAQLFLKF